MISGEIKLRSKKELIERFIEENLINLTDEDSITSEFDKFLLTQK
jgi:type I restriction enzyme R subunit